MPTDRRKQDLLNALANLPVVPARRWRGRLLRAAGVRAHARVDIYAGVRVAGEHELRLAEGCFVNHGCYFDTSAPIDVGEAVALGDHVRIITSDHEVGPDARRAGPRRGRPVSIGRGSWLGSGVTVLPGVTIGTGCVVGSGAVVVQDCEPNGLYVGVPARRVRDLA